MKVSGRRRVPARKVANQGKVGHGRRRKSQSVMTVDRRNGRRRRNLAKTVKIGPRKGVNLRKDPEGKTGQYLGRRKMEIAEGPDPGKRRKIKHHEMEDRDQRINGRDLESDDDQRIGNNRKREGKDQKREERDPPRVLRVTANEGDQQAKRNHRPNENYLTKENLLETPTKNPLTTRPPPTAASARNPANLVRLPQNAPLGTATKYDTGTRGAELQIIRVVT